MISSVCGFFVFVLIIEIPILLILSLIRIIKKKSVKKLLFSILCSICLIFVLSVIGALSISTGSEDSDVDGQLSQEKQENSWEQDPSNFENKVSAEVEQPPNEDSNSQMCEHIWVEIDKRDATEEEVGYSTKQCELCGETKINYIPRLEHEVTFDEIYSEYKNNELRADEKYKNNRYTITATVNGMSTGGLLNLSGGATLTMETKVDNTIVFFYASFEKEQEEALKSINVGDEITFEGECLSAGSWVNCELID